MLLVALFGLCMSTVFSRLARAFSAGEGERGAGTGIGIDRGTVLGTLYALPGIIALFGSYIICRESQEDAEVPFAHSGQYGQDGSD